MKTHRVRATLPLLSVFLAFALTGLCPSGLTAAPNASSGSEPTEIIDELVQKVLDEQGLQRQDLTDDATFVRRIYLDVVGRIPSYREVSEFNANTSLTKRAELIDALLESDGYASHFYNYWEDVLRIKSRDRKTIMVSYQDWIKESLRSNKPYDVFVRELISASGFVWDDPAVGYYLRDAGMPLDNMSNTAQVFLGTRMQCAQCHDHPFDRWTQQEYYHMAAFTFGVDSSVNGYRKIPEFAAFQEVARHFRRAEIRENGGMAASDGRRRASATERRVIRDIFEPLGTEVTVSNRKLKLPDDYAYDDAKPKQVMLAGTPFGPDAKVGKRDNAQEVYARWLTSPENPRFTKSIANRLWKKVMGVGLIEPVDDLKDDTVASHPELMAYLEEIMIGSGYDTKSYLRAILNTRTYQSYVSDVEPVSDQPFYYTGPNLRRMTAEQLWDSVLALAIPDLDEKRQGDSQTMNLRIGEMEMKSHVENVQKLDGKALYAIVKRLGGMQERYIELEKEFRTKLNASKDPKERGVLKREFNEIRKGKNQAVDQLLAQAAGSEAFDRREMMAELSEFGDPEMVGRPRGKAARQLQKTRRNLVRASEVVSPAPPGHFLRQFGESDREIIGNSSDEAAIPQALSLLNGNLFYLISNKESELSKATQSVEGPERMEVIFKSFFARSPTVRERELVAEQLEGYGVRKGYQQVTLALLNSQEFRFIQ